MPSKTELFLDDELLDMTAGVSRRIHPPTKHRLNPVLWPEHWWEGNLLQPAAAVYDADEKLFKTWYRTGPIDDPAKVGGHASYTAYATSPDAVHWEKPLAGAVELCGRRDHNVVMTSAGRNPNPYFQAQGMKQFFRSVVRHPHPKDESEKYVSLFFDQRQNGAYLGYSADGVHWRRDAEPFWRTLVDYAGWGDDTLMSLMYDRLKGKWVMYRRVNPQESERLVGRPGDETWPRPDRGQRVMSYADSSDLKHWENHRIVLVPDADDPADVEFYGLTCYVYAQVYVGYLWVYHPAPGDETIDIQLVTSRDGIHFTRCCRREPFIASGPHNYYDHEIITTDQSEPMIVNDQVHILYTGCNYKHDPDYDRPHSRCVGALCTLMRDRFVSLQTGAPAPCRAATKPLVIEHPKLFLNAATWGDGQIQVEVLGRDWKVIEGFSKDEATVIKGNALDHPVHWKGRDLSLLVGREVRLKFNMADARLHAMSFDTGDRPPKNLPPLPSGTGRAELPTDT